MNDYLFDIIDTIRGELKNICRTRQSNWKELKKKPRILSKYITINSDSKYNLEINKINTSNIDIIIDSLNELIKKDMDVDTKNNTIKTEKLQYIFFTIINKYQQVSFSLSFKSGIIKLLFQNEAYVVP